VLLIRTYAFFSRNLYVLWFLLSALAGVVAYQLYVDTTQMLREIISRSRRHDILIIHSSSFHSSTFRKFWMTTTQILDCEFFLQDKGPCFPMSKPHSAQLLGVCQNVFFSFRNLDHL